MSAIRYILRCADGAYYIGTTRASLERRIGEHNEGTFGGFTKKRRPVSLAFHQEFADVSDAIAAEQQLKRWSRAKKEALIKGDFDSLTLLARGRSGRRDQEGCATAPRSSAPGAAMRRR